ncbi:MAG: PEP-CTERM sorting domain-containing protein [Burkholderiaceae bacterium]|nr:PEP-CTERM sorting domain-containing protein [Burkholderiaceae bacterium]
MNRIKKWVSLLAAGLLAHGAVLAIAPVQSVAYASLSGTLQDFESLAVSDPVGSLLEGLVTLGDVQFGERFDGQELGVTKAPRPGEVAQDWFDDLSYGAPVAGLSLLAGAAGGNLGAYDYGDANGKALTGIGPQNSDGGDVFGLGSISARFDAAQSALGFQVRDADGGTGLLSLYRVDGSLIQTLALGPLQNSFYAFARSDGTADIAGFSLYQSDSYFGIAIDKLKYGGISAVPEPGSSLLLGAGLIALLGARRRGASCRV